MPRQIKVIMEPDGKTVHVLPGTKVVEAAGRAGIIINLTCGGKGTCGKCKVEITKGAPPPGEHDKEKLSEEELAAGYRLACQTAIHDEMTINIPDEVRFFEQQVLIEGVEAKVVARPNITKVPVEVQPPTLEDQGADMDRLLAALDGRAAHPRAELDLVREVPTILRESDFKVTAVLDGDEIICIEPGDTSATCYGLAFDVGTTTIVGMLLELRTGRRLAVSSRTNPQVVYGDDVISRISYATENPRGLEELHKRIVGCINEMVAELAQAAGVKRQEIYEITFVGNTTMSHLLLKITPRNIAQAPYVAVVREALTAKAADLGIELNPHANVCALPNIAGFVGSDTVGVILASGMMRGEELKMAIDIGTNGEIALGSKDRMLACSCAAGPAFEGARIKFGMRAAEGAIEKVLINDDVRVNVIGNVPPRGLCGTALIDAVAELLRVGVVEPSGKILSPDEAVRAPKKVRERIVPGEMGFDFCLAGCEEAHNGEAILLTQKDIREAQLAKGAIFAGMQILKKELGIGDNDITEMLLAGAFGNFIRRSMAKRIGLLPDIPTDRITFIGNAAGAGARMALISKECREEAAWISRNTEYIELGGRPDFQQEFMAAMLFPEK